MTFTEILIMVAQFLLSLSFLIILHEWGHYYPAKLFKIKVEKFYLFFDAFGKSLIKKKIGDTVYGIGWLPLGGYVKIAGMIDESMDKEQMAEEPKEWEFRSKPAWQRLIIMLGGVTVNFVLAYFIYVFVSFTWGDKYIPVSELKNGVIASEFVQKEIGIETGDKIITVDGEKVESVNDLNKSILFGEKVTVERNGVRKELTVPVDILGKTVDADAKRLLSAPRPVVILKVPKDSHNNTIGLKKKDIISAINGEPVLIQNYIEVLKSNAGKSVVLSIVNEDKEGKELTANINEEGKIGLNISTYSLDDLSKLGYYKLAVKKYTFLESFGAGGSKFVGKFNDMIDNVKKLLNSYKTGAAKGMGSFVSIAKIFPTTWDWHFFWNITAFLSIMLGVLNLLPIPALDGGHAVFVLYEMITGKKPGDKFLEYAQMVGFVLMMALFVYAFGNDIYRHFIK